MAPKVIVRSSFRGMFAACNGSGVPVYKNSEAAPRSVANLAGPAFATGIDNLFREVIL